MQEPSEDYILGTDHLGRDQLGRIIKGGQISLMVGLVATVVSLTIGIGYGTISGYFGGNIDRFMMRIVDILYSLPFTIFVILLMVFAKDLGDSIDTWVKERGSSFSISGQWNMLLLFVAIGAVEWLTMARIVRGQVLSLRKQEFIEACISLGLPTHRIIFRHMVPNVLGPVIVYTTLTIPAVMLLEAFLSFLGLGVQPPTPSWGLLIKDGADRMREAPWMLIYPGIMFALALFSFNFVGDGLRDALDPKTSTD
jgi:oligopeptide transport system permease protein